MDATREASLEVLADEIRETLAADEVAYLRWAPGSGSAYELLLIPWAVITTMEQGTTERPQMPDSTWGPGWVMVARGYGGQVYPIRLWDGYPSDTNGRCPFPDYLAEHLGGRYGDGCAMHLLLSAVAGVAPKCTWADADCPV